MSDERCGRCGAELLHEKIHSINDETFDPPICAACTNPIAMLKWRVKVLEAAIRAHRAAYLAAGTVREDCAAEFDRLLWREVDAMGKEAT